jgi:ABC-2 type transport system permease protein
MNAQTALGRASYQAYVRDKTTLFFTFGFPLLFLVVFGLIYGEETVPDSGLAYIDYIAPGVLAWGVGNAAVFGAAFTLMQWRRNDVLRLIRMSPVALPTVLVSRYLVALVIGGLQVVLFLAVAVLPVFGLTIASSWPQAIPVLALGVTAFLALGVVIGNYANTPEAVAAIANCVMVPMAFLSGSFFPIDTMPEWLQTFSRILPLRYLSDGLAGAITGTADVTDTLIACAGLLAFAVVFGLLGVKTFRWSSQR